MRIVFFGSPDYALPTLQRLLADPGVEVVACVTNPPRRRGRSGSLVPTEVGAAAAAAGVPVWEPPRLTRRETAELSALAPDVGVLAASGHLLPRHLLAAFPHGVLNVHASLLPRHRGASPVAAAIRAGDRHSGATIMQLVRELDAGPVLAQVATPIGPFDTTATLTERIAALGAELLLGTLPGWVAGTVTAVPQDDAAATYAPRLAKGDGAIDWSRPATEVWRLVRAMHPWPLATTTYGGTPLTVHEAWPLPDRGPAAGAGAAPGTVIAGDGQPLEPETFDRWGRPPRSARALVACGVGALALLRVQRPGKRPTAIEDYLNGDPMLIGAHLGPTPGGATGAETSV